MFPFIKIFADLYELRPSFLVWRGYNPPTPFILFILTQLSLNRDEQHHDSEERPSRLQYNFFMSSGYLGPFQTEPPADQTVRRSSRPGRTNWGQKSLTLSLTNWSLHLSEHT